MGEGTKLARFRTFGASGWDNIIGDASREFLTQSSERTAELVLESFFCVEDYRLFGVAMRRLFLAGSRATCAEEL